MRLAGCRDKAIARPRVLREAAGVDGSEFGPSPKQLGRTLQGLRQAIGLDLERLAERSGLPRATLEVVEAGRHEADLDTLIAIADGLGVDLWVVTAMAERASDLGPQTEP